MSSFEPSAGASSMNDLPIRFLSISDLLTYYAGRTSAHGWWNLRTARGKCRSFYWLLIISICCSLLLQLGSQNIYNYFNYPTITTSASEKNVENYFPAITICNMNQFLSNIKPGGEGRLAGYNEKLDKKLKAFASKGHYWSIIYLQRLLGSMSEKRRIKSGHKLENMLIKCQYKDRLCDVNDFKPIVTTFFGNCYAFNTNRSLKTQSSGISESLYLVFDVQFDEYNPHVQTSVGLRVVVHDQSTYPSPKSQGFTVAPAFYNYVGLKKHVTIMEPQPYSSCIKMSKSDMLHRDVFVGKFQHTIYSEHTCLLTCIQIQTLTHCNCQDPAYPLLSNHLAFLQVLEEKGIKNASSVPICRIENKIDFDCMATVYEYHTQRIITGNTGEIKDAMCPRCTPECNLIRYRTQVSYGLYDTHNDILHSSNKKVRQRFLNLKTDQERNDYIKTNIAAVSIYLEDLEDNLVNTNRETTLISFISSLGGIFGLWMGLSILTVFEIIEGTFDLCYNYIFCQKILKRRLPDVTQSDLTKMKRRKIMRDYLKQVQNNELDIMFLQHVWRKANLPPFQYKKYVQLLENED